MPLRRLHEIGGQVAEAAASAPAGQLIRVGHSLDLPADEWVDQLTSHTGQLLDKFGKPSWKAAARSGLGMKIATFWGIGNEHDGEICRSKFYSGSDFSHCWQHNPSRVWRFFGWDRCLGLMMALAGTVEMINKRG